MKSTLKAVIDTECINKRFRESRSRLSLTLLFAGAIAAALLGAPPPAVLIYSLCVLFIIFRHTENIKSLTKGEERKLGLFKSEKQASQTEEGSKDSK